MDRLLKNAIEMLIEHINDTKNLSEKEVESINNIFDTYGVVGKIDIRKLFEDR